MCFSASFNLCPICVWISDTEHCCVLVFDRQQSALKTLQTVLIWFIFNCIWPLCLVWRTFKLCLCEKLHWCINGKRESKHLQTVSHHAFGLTGSESNFYIHSIRNGLSVLSVFFCHTIAQLYRQMSNLDVWSCSTTFCETSYTLFSSSVRKKRSFFTASWLIRHIQQRATNPTLTEILKEQLQPKMVCLLSPLFCWGLIHMDYIDWGCALKRTSKNKPPVNKMPHVLGLHDANQCNDLFFLIVSHASCPSFCLYFPFPVFLCPLFPLHCSSPPSLTGDSVYEAWCCQAGFPLLPNRLLRLTLQYIGLWQPQYAVPPLSCLSFFQTDLMSWVGIRLMTFTHCLPHFHSVFSQSPLNVFTFHTLYPYNWHLHQLSWVNNTEHIQGWYLANKHLCRVLDGYIGSWGPLTIGQHLSNNPVFCAIGKEIIFKKAFLYTHCVISKILLFHWIFISWPRCLMTVKG